MRAFLIQHADALVTIALGLAITVVLWRERERFQASPMPAARALPFLAPLLIVFGLLQFVFDYAPHTWRRLRTSDQRAFAEFPSATTTETATHTVEGASVRFMAVNCDVPKRDINLRLSYTEIPPEHAVLTVEQRLNGLLSLFEQQGLTIVSCVEDGLGDIPGCRIVLEGDDGKARLVVRVAITREAVYRVLATSTSGFHDDPLIARFINSFSVH